MPTKPIAAVLLSMLAAVAQDPVPAAPPSPPAPQPTALGTTGLCMVLPPDFDVLDGRAWGARFVAARVHEGKPLPNCNVTDGPAEAPAKDGHPALRAEMIEGLGKLLTNLEPVADGAARVLGQDAFWMSSRFDQGTVRMRNLQVLIPSRPACWLTFTTTDADFAAQEKTFWAAIDSLARVGDAKAAAQAAVRRDGARLVVDETGFSIEPPKGWSEGDARATMGAFLFVAGPAADGFAPNLNVRTIVGAEAFAVADVEREAAPTMQKVMPGCKIAGFAEATIDARRGVRSQATYRSGKVACTAVQYFVPAQPQSFVVTFTVASKDAEALLPEIEKSAGSIKVVAPTPPGKAAKPAEGKPGESARDG